MNVKRSTSDVRQNNNLLRYYDHKHISSLGILYDDMTDEIFAEYNEDGNVVIFSFMVGFNDDPELKSVACNNGGYFYRIQTVGKYSLNIVLVII